MKFDINDVIGEPKKRYTVYWDKVFLALAILIVVIIGVVSLIMFMASGSEEEEPEPPVQMQIMGSSFANKSEESPVEEEQLPLFKVVIDAGHGGEDGGCKDYSEIRNEKDDNLRIALEVAKELEKRNIEVVLTRDEDVFVSLDDRCKIANDCNADLFVSLHRNVATDGNGVEIWVSNKEPAEDTRLAQNIMDELVKVGVSDNRGVRFGYIGDPSINYQVNYDTKMPSCLVELGFISEDVDNELFDKNLYSYANAIADAILETGYDLSIIK